MDAAREMTNASRRLSEALSPGDLDRTLEQITRAAVEVIPEVEHASITVKHADGRLETIAPTAPLLLGLDAAQYELHEGPCYEAAVDTVHVFAPHLAEDPRFPRYAPVAVAAGIEAQAGLRLFDANGSQGALNLYAPRAGVFADIDPLADLFAHQSAMAIAYAREITQLREAVATRQLIGQAVGVAMERFELDEARAFGFLARLSQDNNVKLREVARRLLEESAARRTP
ncbi:GAF and ANTAR domain-containing protein [Nocardioides sediminis]|uniref:GAF and ANTAR domain-containing protein n=1 Tax=Nocardioides sediminis TaxID=433648 RepID=UPI000D30F7A9|nr:GAF and ANTAR domain-containing protein [Nocardioides sediminis]